MDTSHSCIKDNEMADQLTNTAREKILDYTNKITEM